MISGQERKPLSDIIITVPYFIKYDVRVKSQKVRNNLIDRQSGMNFGYVTVNGANSNDYFFIFPLHTYAVHEGLLLQRYISPDAQAGSGLSAEILQIPDQIPDLLPDRMS